MSQQRGLCLFRHLGVSVAFFAALTSPALQHRKYESLVGRELNELELKVWSIRPCELMLCSGQDRLPVEDRKKAELLETLAEAGGLEPGIASKVAAQLDVPEAEVYGAGSFYHLLDDPEVSLRVCTGLSCALQGSEELLAKAAAAGISAKACSCLAACDAAPALLQGRQVMINAKSEDIAGDHRGEEMSEDWRGTVGPLGLVDAAEKLAMNLDADADFKGSALTRAQRLGPKAVIEILAESGLQGRGGAGFPAATKWQAITEQEAVPYVVLNADEGEPGTFKDRDLMLRRPDLVIEGLAIAAHCLGAKDVYLYLRGEFLGPAKALKKSIEQFKSAGLLEGLSFHLHSGHGAYICGEETALLEALEGKRGMPRIKPPFPTQQGLWGKPTLIQNVETISCVPAIVLRGGAWFKALGKTGPGTKLYSLSGDVVNPGTYEMPLGSSLDELVEAAGGYLGELRAFSPGGASSGFLAASERGRSLDFQSLAELGSMLGSAGVVVLNNTRDLSTAVMNQLRFFESESCGQCGPCRIGTRFLREAHQRHDYTCVSEVAWEMGEGSICGLGQVAALPLTSALKYFPEDFKQSGKDQS